MTELLKFKLETREKLYFKKFKYKTSIKAPLLFYLHGIKSFSSFKARCEDARISAWDRLGPYHDTRVDPIPTAKEYEWYEKIIEFRAMFVELGNTTRIENRTLSFYTNDVLLLKHLYTLYPSLTISEIDLSPTGVIYFKRHDPPATNRTYLKSKIVTNEEKKELLDYFNRTPSIYPSRALASWINYPSSYGISYSSQSHFVDYDYEGTQMMLHLLFPNLVGKSYKLEKKPA